MEKHQKRVLSSLTHRAGKETKSNEWSGNYRAFGKYMDSYTESTWA